ncbi:hypothetical protein ACNF5K_02710 [Fannyhessea vaginae]|uniref:hypothetical protein n=1 Tax=Fannyhessea vaginae TaxID=82135 RepID=UPI003A80E880
MSNELFISVASLVISGIAVFFTYQLARKADEANKIARKALEIQKQLAPSPWSKLVRVEGACCEITNTSGRNSLVTVIKAIPEEAAGLLINNNRMPKYVGNGDSFKILIAQVMGGGLDAVKIEYCYEDDPETTYNVTRNVN